MTLYQQRLFLKHFDEIIECVENKCQNCFDDNEILSFYSFKKQGIFVYDSNKDKKSLIISIENLKLLKNLEKL